MNIYEFKHPEGETDWVCAPTIKEARFYYSTYCGSSDTACRKLLKKELETTNLLDLNESEPDWDDYQGEETEDDYCNSYKITETFAEYLKTAKYTEIMATTEY